MKLTATREALRQAGMGYTWTGAALAEVEKAEAAIEALRAGEKWLDLNYGYLNPDSDPLLIAFANRTRAASTRLYDYARELEAERDRLAQDNERLREALRHLAEPNWQARATGQDAKEMAEFAQNALDEDGDAT